MGLPLCGHMLSLIHCCLTSIDQSCDMFIRSFLRDRKISPKFFRPKFFCGRPRGMSVPKCLFFLQDLEGLTEVFAKNFGHWADFSFLISTYLVQIYLLLPYESRDDLTDRSLLRSSSIDSMLVRTPQSTFCGPALCH